MFKIATKSPKSVFLAWPHFGTKETLLFFTELPSSLSNLSLCGRQDGTDGRPTAKHSPSREFGKEHVRGITEMENTKRDDGTKCTAQDG